MVMRWPEHVAPGRKCDQMICLTDLFATVAEVIGVPLPKKGAEDSISFLPSALGKKHSEGELETRVNLVSHSNHGEFAYREGPWKLVFRMSDRD